MREKIRLWFSGYRKAGLGPDEGCNAEQRSQKIEGAMHDISHFVEGRRRDDAGGSDMAVVRGDHIAPYSVKLIRAGSLENEIRRWLAETYDTCFISYGKYSGGGSTFGGYLDANYSNSNGQIWLELYMNGYDNPPDFTLFVCDIDEEVTLWAGKGTVRR